MLFRHQVAVDRGDDSNVQAVVTLGPFNALQEAPLLAFCRCNVTIRIAVKVSGAVELEQDSANKLSGLDLAADLDDGFVGVGDRLGRIGGRLRVSLERQQNSDDTRTETFR